MIIGGRYSFNGGAAFVSRKYKHLLNEIEDIISAINASDHKTKKSKEKTMPGRIIYSPISLNKAIKSKFHDKHWQTIRIPCNYSTEYYARDYQARKLKRGAFREMDFVKEKLGIEVQLGKYAFMVYNVCAKMTIFSKAGFIDAGVEIVPMKQFADDMSTGVSYFEQLVWDLEHRGVSNIDIPVLILGIDIWHDHPNPQAPLLAQSSAGR